MSDLPNTENIHVAYASIAWEIVKVAVVSNSSADEPQEQLLEKFTNAYVKTLKTISESILIKD